jgi:hypothetical protein
VKKVYVSHVPSNVLLVKVLLITVQFVPPVELTHQNVSVQKVNTLTKLTFVEIVTTNVKPVKTTEPVLIVLTILTELVQIIANVMMDIMMTKNQNVNLVLSNVLPAKLMAYVLPVVV